MSEISSSVDATARLIERVENYDFECVAGPLKNCVDWQQLRSSVDALRARVQQDKKEINALHAVGGDLAAQLVEAQKSVEFLDVQREKWRSRAEEAEARVHQIEQENQRLTTLAEERLERAERLQAEINESRD